MVTLCRFRGSQCGLRRRESGALMTDLMVGLSIFALALLPLGVSFAKEMQLVRANYWRGVAMEIVDGEMEILAAGEWRAFANGQSPYAVHAAAATNLPPGQFQFSKTDRHLRLEWTPEQRTGIGAVVREVTVQ
jgi:hypothetical protein